MIATYNPQTKELIVKGDEIQDFQTIIETDEQDYWDTVKGNEGLPLYDINLFDYGQCYHLQYVNLVDDNEGGLQCGDNYQLASLTILI